MNIDFIDDEVRRILTLDEFQVSSHLKLFDSQFQPIPNEQYMQRHHQIHSFYEENHFLIKKLELFVPFKFIKVRQSITRLVKSIIGYFNKKSEEEGTVDNKGEIIQDQKQGNFLKVDYIQIFYYNQPQNRALLSLVNFIQNEKLKPLYNETDLINDLLNKNKVSLYQVSIQIEDFTFHSKKFFTNMKVSKPFLISYLRQTKFFSNLTSLEESLEKVVLQNFCFGLSNLTLKLYDLPFNIFVLSKTGVTLKIIDTSIIIPKDVKDYEQWVENYSKYTIIETNFQMNEFTVKVGLNIMNTIIHLVNQLQENISPKEKRIFNFSQKSMDGKEERISK